LFLLQTAAAASNKWSITKHCVHWYNVRLCSPTADRVLQKKHSVREFVELSIPATKLLSKAIEAAGSLSLSLFPCLLVCVLACLLFLPLIPARVT
jgi:hypothetical protein